VSSAGERAVGESISYEQWGTDFFLQAINQDRVLGAVNAIAGRPIEFGPLSMGPAGLAKVRAHGTIAPASANREPGDQISYRVLLPVDLTVEVDLQVDRQRFQAQLLVPLTVTAVARSGVRIEIVVVPPHGDDVQVELQAEGMRASVLQRLAGIEAEVRRIVVGYVHGELERPEVREVRTIDVSQAIEQVWSSLSPSPPPTTSPPTSSPTSPPTGPGEPDGAVPGDPEHGRGHNERVRSGELDER
jgi:hypothetical protein